MKLKTIATTTVAIAVAAFVSAAVLVQTDGPAKLELASAADLASEQIDADDAIAFWARRVDANTDDYLSRIQLASQYLRRAKENHDPADAFTADAQIDRVLAAVGNDIPALLVKANARSFVHDFAGSRDYARMVLAMDATHSSAIAVAADDDFELGDLDAAATGYTALAARFGDTPEITARLARLAHAQGNDVRAVEKARAAADAAQSNEYAPVDVAYYQLLVAELERGLGHHDLAASAFEAALEQDPEYGGAIEGLAKVRAAQGRLDESEKLWKQSGTLIGAPDFHVLSALGDLAYERGDTDDARAYWDEALSAVDSLPEGERIGFLRDESRFRAARDLDPERALQLARQDVALRQDAFAYDTLAWAQLHTGDVQGALASIDHALTAGVHDAGILYHAAEIYAANNDRTTALEHVRDALALNPRFELYESAGARALLERLTSEAR